MSLDKRLLDILCCPESKQPVSLLSAAQLEAVNRALAAGTVKAPEGQEAAAPLKAGLITSDGQRVYRIDDGIPVMLVDQALDVRGVDGLR